MKKKTVALVLSCGGARCLAHIGAIDELLYRGYDIKVIAGSSGGAVVGGLFAAGKLNAYRDWIITLSRAEVFSLLDISFSSSGFFKGERVFAEMEKVVGDCNIEDCRIPFTAVATDLKAKRIVNIRAGSMFKAIRASSSVPTVLTPISTEEHLLVDGGVLDPIPFQAVEGHDCDLVLAVNINAGIPYEPVVISDEDNAESKKTRREYLKVLSGLRERWASYFLEPSDDHKALEEGKVNSLSVFSVMSRTVDLMEDRIIELTLKHHEPDVLVNVSRDVSGIFEFYKAKELIAAGRKACSDALDQYEFHQLVRHKP